MSLNIIPAVLRQIREQKKLTLDRLSEISGVDRATIHRIEIGKAPKQRRSTVTKLSKHLGVDEDVLTGRRPPQQQAPSEIPISKQQFNVRISDTVRNALMLMARRYRVPTVEIIEIAPLLFFLAAERSLRHRQHVLSKALGAMQEVEESGRSLRHLPPYAFAPSSIDVFDVEQRSINTRDLFGKEVDEAPLLDRDPGYDPYSHNPFVAFLSKELAEFSAEAELSLWHPPVGPAYRICVSEAEEMVGGDKEAAEAILSGVAPLQEMPKELRNAPAEARAKWAKDRSEQHWRDLSDLSLEFDFSAEKETEQ